MSRNYGNPRKTRMDMESSHRAFHVLGVLCRLRFFLHLRDDYDVTRLRYRELLLLLFGLLLGWGWLLLFGLLLFGLLLGDGHNINVGALHRALYFHILTA